jgi:predicted site-specific integrase-resolvase
MKLSEYARQVGVTYRTAWNGYHAGKLRGYQTPTGTIILQEEAEQVPLREKRVAIDTRVSAAENRPNLDSQAERLLAYCAATGYVVSQVVKEVGSAMNDQRPKLLKLLSEPAVEGIVVEHTDRLTRFGFSYIETLLAGQGRRVEVINLAPDETEDLLADLTAMIYSSLARLYGRRRAKRQTEKITAELRADD